MNSNFGGVVTNTRNTLINTYANFFQIHGNLRCGFHPSSCHKILIYDRGVHKLDELQDASRGRGSGEDMVERDWVEPDGDDEST